MADADRLHRLLGFLDHDPHNPALIADAIRAAVDAGQTTIAAELFVRAVAHGPLAPELVNLKGVNALMQGDFDLAQGCFAQLVEAGAADHGVIFNLAWSKTMMADYADANDVLSGDVLATVSRAAGLKVQLLHHLQKLDDALAVGAKLLELYPDDQPLLGALAVVALDAGRTDLAELYAARAPKTPEGLSTIGALKLGEHLPEQSIQLFDQALQINPNSGRSWLGKGLAAMAQGNPAVAVADLDRGAMLLKSHLGSWVAAGWAHFINNDLASARNRFETSMALDARFAENHGGLAVIDLAEGNIESAKKRADRALRLDPRCFSGALARSLLLAQAGNPEASALIRDKAMNIPVSEGGPTIAEALVQFGFVGQTRDNNIKPD